VNDTQRELALVKWFSLLWKQRTDNPDIFEVNPENRIFWSEVRSKMLELGFSENQANQVDLRFHWHELMLKYDLYKMTGLTKSMKMNKIHYGV
jgi:hypothetical protein